MDPRDPLDDDLKAADPADGARINIPEALWLLVRPGRGVRRLARRERIGHDQRSFPRRTIGDAAVWCRSRSRSMWYSLLLACLVGLVLLPGDLSFQAMENAGYAERFLGTLWQVDAAAIALTLAFVIFALESASSSEGNSSLHELEQGTGVLGVFVLGIATLLAIGISLLGVAWVRPTGWAGTWSILASGLGFLTLPVVVLRTLPLLDRDRLFESRIKRVKRQARQLVEKRVVDHLSAKPIEHLGDDNLIGITPEMMLLGKREGHRHEAAKDGYVRDIFQVRLRFLAKVSMARGGKLTLCVYPGQTVRRGAVLAILPDGDSMLLRLVARRTFKISGALPDIRARVDHLQREAVSAVRRREFDRVDQLQGAYREVLLEFPAAWARYGEAFTRNHDADPHHIFGRGPVDVAEDHFEELLRESALVESERLPSSVTMHPYLLGMEGHRVGAPRLTDSALRMLSQAFALSRQFKNRIGQTLRTSVVDSLFGYVKHAPLFAIQRREGPATPVAHEEYVDRAFRAAAEIAAGCIRAGDINALKRIDAEWRELDRDKPWPRSRRLSYRLGLLAWALKLWREQGTNKHLKAVRFLAQGFGSISDAVEALESLDAEASSGAGMTWDSWYVGAPQGANHYLQTNRAFLLLLAGRLEPMSAALPSSPPGFAVIAKRFGREDQLRDALPSEGQLANLDLGRPMGRRLQVARFVSSALREDANASSMKATEPRGAVSA